MTFVSVTDRERGKGKGEVGETDTPGFTRGRVATRTRDRMVAVRDAITQRVQARRVLSTPAKWVDPYADVLTDTEQAAPAVRGRSLWHDGPASPAEQWEYLRAGAWAPGEQHRLVEAIAKAYGLLILTLTVAVAVPLWLAQRPSRTALAAVVLTLLWATGLVPSTAEVTP